MFNELTDPPEVTFESDVYLLLKGKAAAMKAQPESVPSAGLETGATSVPVTTAEVSPQPRQELVAEAGTRTFLISGDVPPEIWNRLGTKVLPKLRSGSDLKIGIEFSVTVEGQLARGFETDLAQILEDLGLTGRVRIEQTSQG